MKRGHKAARSPALRSQAIPPPPAVVSASGGPCGDDAIWRAALADVPQMDAQARARCRTHWQLMRAWARSANLTSIDSEAQAAYLHYRDSLAALPLLRPGSVVDVGSGAGFPGLVLAICRPQLRICLVEPRRRRASFLQVAAAEMGLRQVTVACCRIEAAPMGQFDQAVTRATFSSSPWTPALRAWLRPGAPLWAYRSDEVPLWPQGEVAAQYALTPPDGLHRARRIEKLAAPG